jgi:coatomer subunit beta'
MAMQITTDNEHRFELAIQLKQLNLAFQLAMDSDSEYKWKQLADLAFSEWDLELAEQSMKKAKDYSGLLLLYSSSGDTKGLAELAASCADEGHFNIAFVCYYLLGNTESCVRLLCVSERYAEAAFFARTYAPR